MLNSTVLEVVIGLVFCYASVALIASSVYEAISSLFKLRAKSLLDGIKAMLNDNGFVGLAKDIYNHGLINPRDSGRIATEKQLTFKPSYIDPKNFAVALLESIQKAPGVATDLKTKIDTLPDLQLRQLLQNMYLRADGNIEHLQMSLSAWFDTGMERVSGAYKRQSQLVSFLVALAIAGLFNIDSFHLFSALWKHPALVAQISAANAQNASMALDGLRELPVGWASSARSGSLVVAGFGWLVTASSALFGAPFWFDLLQRLVNLRGTGPKPDQTDAKKAKA
jgi:hypothetical protein